jgi:putative transposase
MDGRKDTAVEALLEHLIEHGPSDIATVFGRAFELAMQIERERFLRAGPYERTAARQGYANGYKPKRIDTPAGTVTVDVPKTAGHDGEPFYPRSLERGRRSVRALMLAVAEMYIKGVSTREVEAVMRVNRRENDLPDRFLTLLIHRETVLVAGQPRRQDARRRTGSLAQPASRRDPVSDP